MKTRNSAPSLGLLLACAGASAADGAFEIDHDCAAGACALGQNVFQANNGGGAMPQWNITIVRDMGNNACVDDGTCP